MAREFVVAFEGQTWGGEIPDPDVLDQAGGRLAVYEPRMTAEQDGPGFTVTLTMLARNEVDALRDTLSLINSTFDGLNYRIEFLSATVTVGAEYERRQLAEGNPDPEVFEIRIEGHS